MVEPVARLLTGRGHRVVRARDAGLADEEDWVVVEYALIDDLVIVTFDPDFRRSIVRRGARCLHVRTPERTARQRLADHYYGVVKHFNERARLVTLPADGEPRRDDRPLGGTGTA
jgi:predicted nuclease of predicted toxin-antitoxin system